VEIEKRVFWVEETTFETVRPGDVIFLNWEPLDSAPFWVARPVHKVRRIGVDVTVIFSKILHPSVGDTVVHTIDDFVMRVADPLFADDRVRMFKIEAAPVGQRLPKPDYFSGKISSFWVPS